jgi:hypothetical protein
LVAEGREVLPGHLAIARQAGHGTYRYEYALIERCLYEVAANGGNSTAARRCLEAENVDRAERSQEPIVLPPVRTIRYWVTGPFRNRYHEICSDQARTLEEVIAAQGVENAIAMGHAEQAALKQTLAGLSNANGIEASTILRNVAQAKGTAVATSQLLRGRPTVIHAETSLEQVAAELEQLGIVEVINSTAEEIPAEG